MERDAELSPLRRGLLWWFGWPVNPYVSVNLAVDVHAARTWLAGLGTPEHPGPTLHHLVAAAIARTLAAFPAANARVVGPRIVRYDHVGIAMPVDRLAHPDGRRAAPNELGLVVLPRAETMTLRELAAATRAEVHHERSGRIRNPVLRQVERLAAHAPQPLVDRTLAVLDRAARSPRLASALHRRIPVTTALSNVGATTRPLPGAWFRGGDLSLPTRLVSLGTFWGVGPVQEEVVPVDGVPTVRPVLPVLMLFDHRLLDGAMAARMLSQLSGVLHDPASTFGAGAER
jgi:pyruvate/2-oxoglutarate dehydrogenase complex dihydrolipoamide acyltransferase (E2) component